MQLFRVIFGYQFGKKEAIKSVASNKAFLWCSIWLVLLSAVARNYDQEWILADPFWLIGNLLFSWVSASLFFIVIHLAELRPRQKATGDTPPKLRHQYPLFLTLFWMTAPSAWLYAIPIERLSNPSVSAVFNASLLIVVSIWRVCLMARVISVVLEWSYRNALRIILFCALIEAGIILGLGGVQNLGKAIAAGMMGMRNAPEEDLLIGFINGVFLLTCILFPVVGGCEWIAEKEGGKSAFKPARRSSFNQLGWMLAPTAIWIAIAIAPQHETKHHHNHRQLTLQGNYEEAMLYLEDLKLDDLSPSKRLAPEPYEMELWDHLPGTLDQLSPTTPSWIQNYYRNYAEIVFEHRPYFINKTAPTIAAILRASKRLAEWGTLIDEHRKTLEPIHKNLFAHGGGDPKTAKAVTEALKLLAEQGFTYEEKTDSTEQTIE